MTAIHGVVRSWLAFGHPRRASGDAADPLLDRFMPAYDVVDRHARHVAPPPGATLAGARVIELDDSRIVRGIFRMREILMRSARDPRPRPAGLVAAMQAIGWGVLAEVADREIVMGAVTKPWQSTPTFRAIPADDFA